MKPLHTRKLFKITMSVIVLLTSITPNTSTLAKEANTHHKSTTLDKVIKRDLFNIQGEDDDQSVQPLMDDFNMSGTTLQGLKTTYLNSLSELQKQNIKLVIPEHITSIDNSAFQQSKTEYKGVRFISLDLSMANNLNKIGDFAFFGSSSMQGVLNFPNSLSSIGSSAFSGCSSLQGDLILPDSLKTLSDHAFDGCSGIKGTLHLPKDLETIANYAFKDAGLTGQLLIPESVKSIGDSAFRQSKAYQGFQGTLSLPNNVKTIGSVAFAYQAGINEVVFPNELSVIQDSVFKGTSLQGALYIPESIQTIGKTSFSETKLETVYLPKMKDSTNKNFIASSSFDTIPTLSAIVCAKEDDAILKPLLSSKTSPLLGYPITITFQDGKNANYEPIQRLFRQSYQKVKNEHDIWKIDTSYQFPLCIDEPSMKWSLSSTGYKAVKETELINQDKLYAITPLVNPTITYSEGIDKVYDGKGATLQVNATHPFAKKIAEAKPGDVVFNYT